jgi:tripartite-type tricarboxylate transporter receptor subunit TctC
MAPFLQEQLGQPVVVENRPGAGELLAHTYYLQQPDDGYTMLSTVAMPYIAVHLLAQKATYKIDDFAYVNLPRNDYTMIAVSKANPRFKTVKEFVDEVRKNPGKVTVGVGAPSGADYINLVLFMKALGLDVKDVRAVHYNTSGEIRPAIIGGTLDVGFIAGLPTIPMADLLDAIMVFRDEPAKPWSGPAFADAMAQADAPGKGQFVAGALGGFLMQASFRDKYPDRWSKLVKAFKAISDDPAKVKLLQDRDLWADWLGPEKSAALVKSTFTAFEEQRSLLKPE